MDIRITWYELGSCCNKTPDHPAYGITRSGLTVQWGMAAVQADTPLVPMGTTVVIKELGADYPMVVTDTGSETAFGSAWLDIYAPSKEIGYWLEQQIGRDGRSDVLVCPTAPR
jgi:3D (Asp-Asp-Asp) domain-containing protein